MAGQGGPPPPAAPEREAGCLAVPSQVLRTGPRLPPQPPSRSLPRCSSVRRHGRARHWRRRWRARWRNAPSAPRPTPAGGSARWRAYWARTMQPLQRCERAGRSAAADPLGSCPAVAGSDASARVCCSHCCCVMLCCKAFPPRFLKDASPTRLRLHATRQYPSSLRNVVGKCTGCFKLRRRRC